MKKKYLTKFYENRHQKTLYSAQTIISHIFQIVPTINSVVDLGCGVGTWLSVFKDKGVNDILGIDGDWVDKNLLKIPLEYFQSAELNRAIRLNRKFDMAISLEVAEHLPPECAHIFVNSLVKLSDIVVFSAAIPEQGGKNHINEQWPDYWVKLFCDNGYVVLDVIRSQVWNDDKILSWYKQNILLFIKEEKKNKLLLSPQKYGNPHSIALSIVHPESYEKKIRKIQRYQRRKRPFKLLLTNFKKIIKGFFMF